MEGPCGVTLKTPTCWVSGLLLQYKKLRGCLDTGSLGLSLIFTYLENLTARDVGSSWKKHWGLQMSPSLGDRILRR